MLSSQPLTPCSDHHLHHPCVFPMAAILSPFSLHVAVFPQNGPFSGAPMCTCQAQHMLTAYHTTCTFQKFSYLEMDLLVDTMTLGQQLAHL